MRRGDLLVGPWGALYGGRRFACSIGRGGISTNKREGDGATPVGTHRITGLLYRPDRIATGRLPTWAVPIEPGDLWSDDVRDPDYNHMVRAPHPFGHERLSRADPLYDVILTTGWNWPWAEPGRGSAIFLHSWRAPRYPTAGCVAFALPDLLWIANRLRPEARLIVH